MWEYTKMIMFIYWLNTTILFVISYNYVKYTFDARTWLWWGCIRRKIPHLKRKIDKWIFMTFQHTGIECCKWIHECQQTSVTMLCEDMTFPLSSLTSMSFLNPYRLTLYASCAHCFLVYKCRSIHDIDRSPITATNGRHSVTL